MTARQGLTMNLPRAEEAKTFHRQPVHHPKIASSNVSRSVSYERPLRLDALAFGFTRFDQPFDSRRILVLLIQSEFPGDDAEDDGGVEIFFFHREGMASLFGVGLQFSKVVLKPNCEIIKVEEVKEEEWTHLWTPSDIQTGSLALLDALNASLVSATAHDSTENAAQAPERFNIGQKDERRSTLAKEMNMTNDGEPKLKEVVREDATEPDGENEKESQVTVEIHLDPSDFTLEPREAGKDTEELSRHLMEPVITITFFKVGAEKRFSTVLNSNFLMTCDMNHFEKYPKRFGWYHDDLQLSLVCKEFTAVTMEKGYVNGEKRKLQQSRGRYPSNTEAFGGKMLGEFHIRSKNVADAKFAGTRRETTTDTTEIQADTRIYVKKSKFVIDPKDGPVKLACLARVRDDLDLQNPVDRLRGLVHSGRMSDVPILVEGHWIVDRKSDRMCDYNFMCGRSFIMRNRKRYHKKLGKLVTFQCLWGNIEMKRTDVESKQQRIVKNLVINHSFSHLPRLMERKTQYWRIAQDARAPGTVCDPSSSSRTDFATITNLSGDSGGHTPLKVKCGDRSVPVVEKSLQQRIHVDFDGLGNIEDLETQDQLVPVSEVDIGNFKVNVVEHCIHPDHLEYKKGARCHGYKTEQSQTFHQPFHHPKRASSNVSTSVSYKQSLRLDALAFGFTRFDQPFDSRRILVLLMQSVFPGDDAEDEGGEEIIFFHQEGMACFFGVGLQFSKVVLKPNCDIIKVEEVKEEEWTRLWMQSKIPTGSLALLNAVNMSLVSTTAHHSTELAAQAPEKFDGRQNSFRSRIGQFRLPLTLFGGSTGGTSSETPGAEMNKNNDGQPVQEVTTEDDTGADAEDEQESQVIVKIHLNPHDFTFEPAEVDNDTELPKYPMEPVITITFFKEPGGYRKKFNTLLNVNFFMKNGVLEDPNRYGWNHDDLRLSFKCMDSNAVTLGKRIVHGEERELQHLHGHDNSKTASGSTRLDGKVLLGSKDFGGVNLGVGNTKETTTGFTDRQSHTLTGSRLCVKNTNFVIVRHDELVELGCLAHVLDHYDLWNAVDRENSLVSGRMSGVEIAVEGDWIVYNDSDSNRVRSASAEEIEFCAYHFTCDRSFKMTHRKSSPKDSGGLFKLLRGKEKVTPQLKNLKFTQKIAKPFVIDHSFSHLGKLTGIRCNTHTWQIAKQAQAPDPICRIIKIPDSSSPNVTDFKSDTNPFMVSDSTDSATDTNPFMVSDSTVDASSSHGSPS